MVEKDKRRAPGRPRKFDRDEALDKAVLLFWEFGYDATDTETLSKAMGISKPSLYNAFGSKEKLFLAALGRYAQTRIRASFEALLVARKPDEGIRDFFRLFAQNVAGEGHPLGCMVMNIAMPIRNRLPSVAKILDTMPAQSRNQMTNYFRAQIDRGHLPPDFNLAEAIALFQDLSAAMSVQARAGTPLHVLEQKAVRNARLVLQLGRSGG